MKRRNSNTTGKWNDRRKRGSRRQRQGAVLLVVLSLLVLFVLIGVTYAVVASQHKAAAKVNARPVQLAPQPQKIADEVIYQMLRDTTNPNSALLGHSLLRDLYGNDGVSATVTGASYDGTVGDQFVIINFQAAAGATQPFGQVFRPTPGYYNGSVLTMLNGPASGHSTRITSYAFDPATNQGQIRVERFDSDLQTTPLPVQGNILLINGKPFNGLGYGYDTTTGGLTQRDPIHNMLVNLQPNFSGYRSLQGLDPDRAGSDESYDAVDYRNMLLAMVCRDPGLGSERERIIPSMHRPSLVNYWWNHPTHGPLSNPAVPQGQFNAAFTALPEGRVNPNTIVGYREFRRKYIFRPMPWDHPNFSGSNPHFAVPPGPAGWNAGPDGVPGRPGDDNFDSSPENNSEYGSIHSDDYPLNDAQLMQNLTNSRMWDVDNDGDGLTDSIWIDIGLPVRTSPSGRKYRPLVALLVKDMDGRVNLNSASNLAQFPINNGPGRVYAIINHGPDNAPGVQGYDDDKNGTDDDASELMWPGSDDFYQVAPMNLGPDFAQAGPPQPLVLPRGLGFGPAETNLASLFRPHTEAMAIVGNRYGAGFLPGRNDTAEDLYSFLHTAGEPRNYATSVSRYMTPNDTRGQGIYGYDYTGHPIYGPAGLLDATVDKPYEFHAMQNVRGMSNAGDAPYTVAELEALLRTNDGDNRGMALRLLTTAPKTFLPRVPGDPTDGLSGPQAQRNRSLFTVHSSHIPVAGTIYPREMRGNAAGPVMAGPMPAPPVPGTLISQDPLSPFNYLANPNPRRIKPISIVDLYEERIRLRKPRDFAATVEQPAPDSGPV